MSQMPRNADPRLRAAQALVLVEQDGLGSQLALRDVLDAQPPLAGPDRGLCTELVYGVLRRRRALDRWLETSCRQGLYDLDEPALAILRLGALQLADLRIPPHAAVHATVETAKRLLAHKQISFVHAVLRDVARRMLTGDRPTHDDLPAWLARRVDAWAVRAHVDPQVLARAQSLPAPLFVHALDGDGARLIADLAAEGVTIAPLEGLTAPGVGRVAEGRFLQSQVFVARRALAQDAASAAVVEWLAASVEPGMQVADIAAGHGVKSARLVHTGAQVTAIDQNADKLLQAAQLCEQIGQPLAATIAGDATQALGIAPETFDAILLDAPCTALGTLRRRPELRHRRMAADILRMAELQARLLKQAAIWLKPGGVLLYAVCSFTEEEGPRQIADFLAAHPDFQRAPGNADWLQGWLNADGDLATSPALGGVDGFYAARLQKRAEAPKVAKIVKKPRGKKL